MSILPDALEFSFRSDVSLRREKVKEKKKEKRVNSETNSYIYLYGLGDFCCSQLTIIIKESLPVSGGKLVAPLSDLISALNCTI